MQMSNPVPICIIGSGYVGLVAAVCFAEMGHRVICVDNDEKRIKTLRDGGVPIYEEHLPELLEKHRNRTVAFTTELTAAVEQSDAIFIAVGTPQGSSGAADLSFVEAVVAEIARSIKGYKVIVEKSTVPVYTNEWIRRVLSRHGVDSQSFDVVSNPEFLREGSAIVDFLHPDRIVVGTQNERSANLLRRIYEPLDRWQLLRSARSVAGALQRRPSCHAAGYFRAERRTHQARFKCLSGVEDFVYQRRGQSGRGRGCRYRGYCSRHGSRQPNWAQIPARRIGVWRFLLPQRCGRIPLGGAKVRRGFPATGRDSKNQRDPEGSLL